MREPTVLAAAQTQAAGESEVYAGDERDRRVRAGDFRRLPLVVAGAQMLLQQWERALACADAARGGNSDAVHKTRVALRRFRAAARVFGRAVDRATGEPVADQLAADAAAVARPLGRVRDLDVFIAYLQREAEQAPHDDAIAIEGLIERRRVERAAAHEAAREALDGTEMRRLHESVAPRLGPLAAAINQPKGKRRTVGRQAPRLVARRLRKLRRLDKKLVVPRPEDLHRVRIGAKHLRYTAEFFASAYPEALPPVVESATHIQDALGEVHDLDVFADILLGDVERVAHDPPRAADAAGIARVIRRGREQRAAALARFRTLWEALPKPGTLRKQLERSGSGPHRENGERTYDG